MDPFFTFFLIAIVAAALAYAAIPRPKTQRPSLEEINIPRANQGDPIPMVFGVYRIRSSTVVWYGDPGIETETEDGVQTRKFYLGIHFVPCHGPIDALTAIYCGQRLAWEGDVTESQTITISAGSLFGGKRLQGGVSGNVDVMFGEATQLANAYLASVQVGPQSAYRGLLSIVANKPYVGANSTSIEPWAFDVSRILNGWPSDDCWYPEKAPVLLLHVPLSYDDYLLHDDDGPLAAHHWKLSGNTGTFADAGAEIPVSMTLTGDLDGTTYNEPTILAAGVTDDGFALLRGGLHQATLSAITDPDDELTGTFDAWGWCDLQGNDEQILFKSSRNGEQGYWRGVDLYFPPGADYLLVVYGDNNGNYRRYKTADGSFSPTGLRFWVLRVVTSEGTVVFRGGDSAKTEYRYDVNDVSATVYIDGELQTLTYVIGSATQVTFPVYTAGSVPDGWHGVAFDSTGDTYGFYPQGLRDQLGLNTARPANPEESGGLSAIRIAEMDRRGRGAYADTHIMNPAHIIYQAIIDPLGMGYPSALIDDESFRYAADLFFDEGLGLCLIWNQQEPVEDFIQHICDHAGAVFRTNPRTSKFQLIPLRDDYTPASLQVFDESNIVSVESFERIGYGELVGEISLTYRDMFTAENASVTVQNLAVIQSQSGVVAETISLPGIPTVELANRVAMRELRSRSIPLAKIKFKVDRSAWELAPGDVFKISWAKYGLTEVIFRLGSIGTGTLTDGTIAVEAIEDVFGMPASTYAATQESGWVAPSTEPEAAEFQTVLEMPYWWIKRIWGPTSALDLDTDAGFGYPLGAKPQALSGEAEIWRALNGGSYAEANGTAVWSGYALLNGAITGQDTTLTIDGAALGPLEVGRLIQIGEGADAEIIRLTGGNLTTSITAGRGHLDTTPRSWPDNTRLWTLPGPDMPDLTQYSDGDDVDYKLLTIVSDNVLGLAQATAASITFASRQVRPIPPGRIRFDGDTIAWPDALDGVFTVYWEPRNRRSHSDDVNQSAEGITSELGVTYNVYAYDDSDDTLLDSDTGLTGTDWTPSIGTSCTLRIEIESERAGFVSWQRQIRIFEYGTTDAITAEDGEFLATEDGEILITES